MSQAKKQHYVPKFYLIIFQLILIEKQFNVWIKLI